ncbi:MAG: hypothetical protein QMC95_12015 [Desulfitobacteriaceae bacterium]|nr:hypothetical protein [Desulfitobacteriaceae bacterium]MDI6881093.1 hypothetical protein [Desulfitobacteriaceae bacterium]MDI6914932.1 hypothetical protein [Desulfitobacteriaceae bacterium]
METQELATRITVAWLNAFATITKELSHVEQHIPTPSEVREFFLTMVQALEKSANSER